MGNLSARKGRFVRLLAYVLLFAGCSGFSEGGRAMDLKRPVLPQPGVPEDAAGLEKELAIVMGMSEEEMADFMPEYSFVLHLHCPECWGSRFDWEPARPAEMACRDCGLVLPDREKYPERSRITGRNALGEEISFPYYDGKKRHPEDEDPRKRSRRFISLRLDGYRWNWIRGQALKLGQAYRLTGKPEYARRAAVIIERAALRYPHWPAMGERRAPGFRFLEDQTPPFIWDAGRWTRFHNEIPKTLVRAYDLVYDSPELDRLSQERGYNVRRKIEEDLFLTAFEIVKARTSHSGNVIGYQVSGVGKLGRVINEPDLVHWAFGRMEICLNEAFYADGMWREGTPSYHNMTLRGFNRGFSWLRGHTDPPGYVHRETGRRFDDLVPEEMLPFWGKVQKAHRLIDYPDGTYCTVNDTHYLTREEIWRRTTRSTSLETGQAPVLMPAFGHAVLGRGFHRDQMQAHLHFAGGYGHQHHDNLNIILWARESEMLPDIGYGSGTERYWTECSLAHNLVVVNREDQSKRRKDGNLINFFPDIGGVSMVEAEGTAAYRNIEGLDRYERMLMLVPVSGRDSYVVDIFRVRGGKTHDWTIQGDADEDTEASASLKFTGRRKNLIEPGEEWEDTNVRSTRYNPYGLVRDVNTAVTKEGFRVDFRYVYSLDDKCLRVHILEDSRPREVFLGRSPSVRRGARGNVDDFYNYWMPKLVVRRSSDSEQLSSVFTAVYEPYGKKPFISSVERLELAGDDPDVVALRVNHGRTSDIIISTIDSAPYPERITDSGVSLRGRLGILREEGGAAASAWLLRGERISAGRRGMELPAAEYRGTLESVMRKIEGDEYDAFVTAAGLPEGEELNGTWMVVYFDGGRVSRGFRIDRVEAAGEGGSVIILSDDPAVRIEGDVTSETHHPRRRFTGENFFVIPLAAGTSISG